MMLPSWVDEPKERRLAESYARLQEGKLEEIAADADSLTEAAREALRAEMSRQRMQAAPVAVAKEAAEGSDLGSVGE